MKIFLTYPPCGELNLKGYPLGLAYLSAPLKEAHDVEIFDYNGKPFHQSIRNFLASVKREKPDIVAISFTSFNRWGAYQIIEGVKKIDKKIRVALGGVHPSTLYNQLFEHFGRNIDFIIRSEGEHSLLNLCNALESKKDFSSISGLVYRTNDGKIKANPVSDIARNLDDLPIPDYSFASDYIKNKGLAFLITSRGCPANCSFCSTSSFWGQAVRMHSPERIASEAEHLKGMGAKRLFFHDDTFNLGIERTIKIAGILKKLDMEYVIQCRVSPVNEDMIAALVDSGCRHITWGMESLSDTILKNIDKKITKEQAKNACDICAKFSDKLSTSAYFCVGTPGETEETVNESVKYLNENIRLTHGAGASMLYILPGTRIYADLIRQNKFNEKVWVKNSSVFYYTREHDIWTLNRWRKLVNKSGVKIPFKGKYFWDSIPKTENQDKGFLRRRAEKTLKKLNRRFNFILGRY